MTKPGSFRPGGETSVLRRMVKSALVAFFRLPPACPVPFGIRWRLLQLVGVHRRIPWPVHFTSTVHAPDRIKLGRRTYPGDSPGCYIQALNGIEIDDDTNLGPGVGLISANHDPLANDHWIEAPPIRLGKRCWLGMNAIVLPGVELGDNTIVGAGSIVTRSFPDGNCVIGGNPARLIRKLDEAEKTRGE